jgi:hypothetical protein
MKYAPPHVANESYVRALGLKDPGQLYTKMADNVWLLDKRLTDPEMVMLDATVRLTIDGPYPAGVREVRVSELYRPVYVIGFLFNDGTQDFGNIAGMVKDAEPALARINATPISWWLRLDLMDPAERVRYPEMAEKVNMKEGFDLGDGRELYSWDGSGFKLRELDWRKAG